MRHAAGAVWSWLQTSGVFTMGQALACRYYDQRECCVSRVRLSREGARSNSLRSSRGRVVCAVSSAESASEEEHVTRLHTAAAWIALARVQQWIALDRLWTGPGPLPVHFRSTSFAGPAGGRAGRGGADASRYIRFVMYLAAVPPLCPRRRLSLGSYLSQLCSRLRPKRNIHPYPLTPTPMLPLDPYALPTSPNGPHAPNPSGRPRRSVSRGARPAISTPRDSRTRQSLQGQAAQRPVSSPPLSRSSSMPA